jgi:hypothetical protein
VQQPGEPERPPLPALAPSLGIERPRCIRKASFFEGELSVVTT